MELAIICKNLSTGGSEYDGRKVAEARKLVQAALENYPELADKKRDFLMRQLVGINLQQAEKDFKIAEFYKRTGTPARPTSITRSSGGAIRTPSSPSWPLSTQRAAQLKLEQTQNGPDEKGYAPAEKRASRRAAPPPRKCCRRDWSGGRRFRCPAACTPGRPRAERAG